MGAIAFKEIDRINSFSNKIVNEGKNSFLKKAKSAFKPQRVTAQELEENRIPSYTAAF